MSGGLLFNPRLGSVTTGSVSASMKNLFPMRDLDLLGFDDPELFDTDADLLFHSYPSLQQEEKKRMEVMAWGADKWKGMKGRMEVPKNNEKAAKVVNLKMSPRMIQQPR
ncbi:hypothetical protein IHE45_12G062800 [Dioscorea alata]|uniref:Uncharacterized protein n=1 Tax=Dioscorea alata TaxID=55571 RepID=A0ACB7V2T7_DIOAL|nr:hypothetical protein IHE45_12G062800 [Dioscorea alata]